MPRKKKGKTQQAVVVEGTAYELDPPEDDEEDDGVRMIPVYDKLADLYRGFDYESGIYRTQVRRHSPVQTPEGIPCAGFLKTFGRPLYEDDVERIFGGGKYELIVRGPRDPESPHGDTVWVASSRAFKVGGAVKMPPDFSRVEDRPIDYVPSREEVEKAKGETGGNGASVQIPGAETDTSRMLLAAQLEASRRAEARADQLASQLHEMQNRDPNAEATREMAKLQTAAWNRQMEMQAAQSERFSEILATVGQRGDQGESAQHFLATIESLKTALETAQRESQRMLSEAQSKATDALARTEETHREERSRLVDQYERRERDLRDAFSRDLDSERRRAEDEIKRADRRTSELRTELREARTRIDTLQDQLSEARMQVAAGGAGAKDPVQQLQAYGEAFSTLKGVFGGSSNEDVVSRIFDSVESGALEKTIGGVAARVGSAWKGSGAGQPNPQTQAANSQAWEQYSRAQAEARRKQSPQGQRRMRGRAQNQGQLPQGQAQATQGQAQGEGAAMSKAQDVARAALAATPPGFIQIDGREAQVKDLGLLVQRALEAKMPAARFAVILRPALGGEQMETQLLSLSDTAVIEVMEGQIGGRLPGPSRQYLREVLQAFRALLKQEAEQGGTIGLPEEKPKQEPAQKQEAPSEPEQEPDA